MSIKDYFGLMHYLKIRDKKMNNKMVPLKDSQKEMIKKVKKDA